MGPLRALQHLASVRTQPVTKKPPTWSDAARDDEGAAALPHLNHLKELEHPEALAHGDTRDTELFGELALRGKLLAPAQTSGLYCSDEFGDDAVGQPLGLQGPEHGLLVWWSGQFVNRKAVAAVGSWRAKNFGIAWLSLRGFFSYFAAGNVMSNARA